MAGAISGIAAANAESPYQNNAIDETQQGVGAFQNLSVPDLANKLYLQQYQSAGNLTPAQEQTINASPSQAAATQANPSLVNAQMQALQGLKTASNTGYTPQTQAALNQIQHNAAVQSQGQQQAVMNQYAQRGQAGSGNQLLAQLQASQNAGNQANQQSTQAAGQASQNALSALGQYGGQAGQMNQQQFGQQFQAGTAADQLNRFNVQNQVSQQARNVAQQNAANQYNLQNQQGIQNANTGQANAEQQREMQAQQQMFSDQAQRASGLSGASFNAGNVYGNIGQQVGQGITNIGAGFDQGVGAAMMADGGEVPYGGGQTYDVGGTVNGPQAQSYNPLLGPAMQHMDDGGTLESEFDNSSNPDQQSNPLSGLLGMLGGGGQNSSKQQSPKNLTDPIGSGGSQSQSSGSQPPNWGSMIQKYNQNQMNNELDNSDNAFAPNDASNQPQGMLTASRGITIPNPNMNNAPSSLMGLMQHGGKSTMPQKQAGLPPPQAPKNPAAMAALANLISRGGKVPGKPMYAGDTIKNDNVPVRLSPGEIVLPRTVANHPDAPEKAAEFVAKEKAKKRE